MEGRRLTRGHVRRSPAPEDQLGRRWLADVAWQHALIILDDLQFPDAEHVRVKLARLDTPTYQATE